MADVRNLQYLEQIRDLLGFPLGGSATLYGLASLNTTASLINDRLLTVASNISEVNRQLALLNTTVSHVDSRLAGTRFAAPRPNEMLIAQVSNPVAGNNSIIGGPLSGVANIIHKIHLSFCASHASPGKDISFRDGTAGTTYFITRVPPGFSSLEIDLPAPWAQTTQQAGVCFVATGFSAVGSYEVMYMVQNPNN